MKEYDGFLVDNNLNFYSKRTGRKLTPYIGSDGYKHVQYRDAKQKTHHNRVHIILAHCFIPNPNNYRYVNHKDENTQNNKVSNLEWCTNSYNLIYSKGKKVAQYTKEGKFIKDFNCVADASREYNIPTTNISKCCKGKRCSAGNFIWRYV